MSPNVDPGARAPVRLMQVVGARPQFVKLAPVCRAIAAANAGGANIESFVVHTGQHYDPAMSDVFFAELGIPEADIDLGVGSGSHGRQTARMLESLEAAMLERQPHLVLTYGDTNSTLAATLAAAKLHLPLAHVEAGLRSFNRRMPEEANRLVADQLSDLLFAPTPEAMKNLANEGLGARARQVGDVMLDAIRDFAPVALERSRVLERLGLAPGDYLVATLHRAENTPAERLGPLLAALAAIGSAARPVILPLHPRTANVMREAGIALPEGSRAARDRAARLPRHDRARRPRARRAHGFRRPAEGGVLPRQALRDAARRDGMGGDGHRPRQRDHRNRPGEDPRRGRVLGRGARARRAGLCRGGTCRLRRRRRVREDHLANPAIPGSWKSRLSGLRPLLRNVHSVTFRAPFWATCLRYRVDIRG